MHIITIGMRGAGKTWIGKILADEYGMPFLDIDDHIQEQEGMSIDEMVEKHGWDYFRRKEFEAINNCGNIAPSVIATGGGLPIEQQNQEILKKLGYIVWIKTDIDVMLDYIAKSKENHRPSITGKGVEEEFREVYEKREPIYEELADFTFDTSEDFGAQIETLRGILEKSNIL